jgi:hypothetical protein
VPFDVSQRRGWRRAEEHAQTLLSSLDRKHEQLFSVEMDACFA